jgi:hypothetical protein
MGYSKSLKAFTLIEIVTGFALVGLVSILIATLYFAHFRLFSNQNTSIEVSTQNRLAIDEIVNQVRESQSVVDTCTGCSGDTTSSTVLVLRLWRLDSNGEPTEPTGSEYDYVIYKRDPSDTTNLIKKTVPDPTSSRQTLTKIIATRVSDLQFAYDNTNPDLITEISVTLTNSSTVNNKVQTTTQSSTAILRNK